MASVDVGMKQKLLLRRIGVRSHGKAVDDKGL